MSVFRASLKAVIEQSKNGQTLVKALNTTAADEAAGQVSAGKWKRFARLVAISSRNANNNLNLNGRKKWSRKRKTLTFLAIGGGTAMAATFTSANYGVNLERPLGPIYKFEEDADLPKVYDVEKIKEYWSKRPGEVLSRTGEILSKFVPYLTRLTLWEMLIRGGRIFEHEGLQRKYAIELRTILTELGPCFIKLGQALSIRPDLLPSSVLFELQKLCDEVPSYPTPEAIGVIERELNLPVGSVFKDLDNTVAPIAAASLGQVYKLRLKADDSVVAVKVQRPDMLSSVLKDIYILRKFANVIQSVKKVITNQRPYDVALVDNFAAASLKELDYIAEAGNQERFRDELAPKLKGQIYVPKVYREYTTRQVLVTEWVEGEKLAKSPKETINKLTPVGVECFLTQLLETGFFHADPHPGNLLVTPEGNLALIDFGLCAEVPLPDTPTLTLTIVHIMQGDVPGLVSDAIKLGFLPEDVDQVKLVPALQSIFDNAQLALEQEWRKEQIEKTQYKAVVSRRKRFMAVSYDLNKVFFEYPFLVPDYFALITRAMIVLEGIAVTGDPEFDLFASAQPYALRRAVGLFGYDNLSVILQEAFKRMTERNLL